MSSLPSDLPEHKSESVSRFHQPEYDLAIKQNSATIDYIFDCVQLMKSEDEESARGAIEYYPKLVKAFENKWGNIRKYYGNSISACATTEKGYLFHTETKADLETLELLHKFDKLSIESRRLLGTRDRMCCLDLQYELLTHLLGSMENLESGNKTKEEHIELVHYLTKEFEEVKKQFLEGAQRNAVLEYYVGMFQGLFFILAIALIFKIYSFFNPSFSQILNYISISFTSGGIGAIISVIQRMSTGQLNLDKEADPSHNNRLGLFRTIIGSVMGVLIYFLIMSELIPFSIPSESEIRFFYISSLSFSAGFTERWVQDMLPSAADKDIKIGEPS